MSTLPKTSSDAFCKAFIKRELKGYKEKHIWMSSWKTMERLIDRSEEMQVTFEELIAEFGYSDRSDPFCSQTSKNAIWLVLEHIWRGHEYDLESVNQAREERKTLNQVDNKVLRLAEELVDALHEQENLYEQSGFPRADYQSAIGVLELARENHTRYLSYISGKIKPLASQFDFRYWPDRSELI
jgi:hypothetical protein